MTTLKIAHITDIHIAPREGELLEGIDVQKNFLNAMDAICAARPDCIILGGDLAEDGDPGSYQWIKTQLDRIGITYHIMAGNHDRIENLNSTFGLMDRQDRDSWYFGLEKKGRRIFCLDTSSNFLPEHQLDRLEADIGNRRDEVLLFIHHPPIMCDCLFMDKNYPLKNWQEAFRRLRSIPQIKNIVCGHYHTEKTIQSSGITIFLTPSTYVQISQDNRDFEISDYRPGWRWIKWEGETLYSSVFYVR